MDNVRDTTSGWSGRRERQTNVNSSHGHLCKTRYWQWKPWWLGVGRTSSLAPFTTAITKQAFNIASKAPSPWKVLARVNYNILQTVHPSNFESISEWLQEAAKTTKKNQCNEFDGMEIYIQPNTHDARGGMCNWRVHSTKKRSLRHDTRVFVLFGTVWRDNKQI